MTDNKLIGNRISQRRKELGKTMGEVATDIGVATSTIMRYEKGNFSKIKMPIIEAIASALNVNPEWIIGDTDDPINYDDPELIASIPLSYVEGCNGDIRRAFKVQQAADSDARAEQSCGKVEGPDVTFNDFTYALHNETKELTEENKQKLLEMARFFKEQQDKKKKQ